MLEETASNICSCVSKGYDSCSRCGHQCEGKSTVSFVSCFSFFSYGFLSSSPKESTTRTNSGRLSLVACYALKINFYRHSIEPVRPTTVASLWWMLLKQHMGFEKFGLWCGEDDLGPSESCWSGFFVPPRHIGAKGNKTMEVTERHFWRCWY